MTPLEIPIAEYEPIGIGSPVENTKVGELQGDIWLTKNGKLVVNNSDWVEFDIGNFSYSSDNVLSVSGIDASLKFQVGDRIRIEQTTTKYFYVYAVSSTQLKLAGGANTFNSSAFTSVSRSGLSVPSGMGGTLPYTLVETADTGTPTFNDQDARFSMTGNIVNLYIDCGVNFSTSTQQLKLTLPFSVTSNFRDVEAPIYAGAPLNGDYLVRAAINHAVDTSRLWISTRTYGTFGDTFSRFDVNVSYVYIP